MSKVIGVVLLCCIYNISFSQDAKWFVGVWTGAHTVVKGKQKQSLDISLNIETITGTSFTGYFKLSASADTSVHLDIRIIGDIQHDFIRATFKDIIYKKDPPGNTWDTRCMNCGPKIFFYSIKDGKFILTTETTGCYKTCNGTSVYSRDLNDFDPTVRASLDTLVNKGKNLAVVQDTALESPPVALVAPQKDLVIEKINPADIIVIAPKKDSISNTKTTAAENSVAMKPSLSIVTAPRKDSVKAGELVAVPKKDSAANRKNIVIRTDTAKVKPPIVVATTPKKDSVKVGGIVAVPKKDSAANRKNIVIKKDTAKVKPPVAIVTSPKKDLVNSGGVVAVPPKDSSVVKKKIVSKDTSQAKPTTAVVTKPKADTVAVVKIEPVKVIAVPPKKDNVVSPKQEQYEKRSANLVKTYLVSTDSVVLRLFDNGVMDGDTISVFNNGQVLVSMLGLTSSGREIKMAVDKTKDNEIVFYAHNLGLFPPNTALLDIYSGKIKYSINISSDLHVSSGIVLHYVKP